MRLIDKVECEDVFRSLGVSRDGVPGRGAASRLKTIKLAYTSRLASAREAGAVLAGLFRDKPVVLWAHDPVLGDRTGEPDPPADWIAYVQWRAASGDTRPLREAPGHQFDAGDADGLSAAIAHALLLGWDALVGARKGPVIALSHNDVVTLHVRSRPSEALASLEMLGFRLC